MTIEGLALLQYAAILLGVLCLNHFSFRGAGSVISVLMNIWGGKLRSISRSRVALKLRGFCSLSFMFFVLLKCRSSSLEAWGS